MEDKRKTNAETEELPAQECAIRVFKGLNGMTSRTRTDEDWRNWGRSFGKGMGGLLKILEAVETGVDVENYPRAMFQDSLEVGKHRRERVQTQPQIVRQVKAPPTRRGEA